MDEDLPPAKRPRLSMACNECRRRKVKCDTEIPKCRNCRLRNDVCITTDPKRPQVVVPREWIEQPEAPQLHSSTTTNQNGVAQSLVSSQSPRVLMRPDVNQSPHSTAVSATWTDNSGISPAHQPYEMAFTTDTSTDRIKMMGASSSQCLMKTLDLYLESVRVQPLSGHFRHAMRQLEEMEFPLLASLPALPEASRRQLYVSAFFDRIHPLYPMFDIDKLKTTIEKFASMSDFQSLTQEQLPLLVSAYLILSTGADEEAQERTADGTKYLIAATSFLGHITLIPYLPAVQTLLLFTIAYRGRNKDGVGWQTLGIAIRIAHTLGLHRHSAKNPSNQHGIQNRPTQLFHARIWAICCSLEKMMQLESGRPSTIRDVDRDHMMAPQHPKGHDFLQWHMGLAQLQGLISHHIYGHKSGDRTAREILSDTARLDRALLLWARDIPEEFRPGNDLFCSSQDFHIAALLSIQYFQTVIALHRAALIAPASRFLLEVASHEFDDSSRLRLQAGESICVNSARSIARLIIELSDRNVQSLILTGTPYLLACIVLGISMVKNRRSLSMAADLELLKVCVEYTANQYLKSGHDVLFARGITSIYEQVRLHSERKSGDQVSHHKASNAPSISDLVTSQEQNHQLRRNSPQDGNNYKNIDDTSKGSNRTLIIAEHSLSDVGSSFHSYNHQNQERLARATVINIDDELPLITNQDFYSNSLPFGNLNVQELWTWMGDLDGYDGYSYQGSYDGSAPM